MVIFSNNTSNKKQYSLSPIPELSITEALSSLLLAISSDNYLYNFKYNSHFNFSVLDTVDFVV